MQGFKCGNHAFRVLVIEEQPGSFFKAFMPQLVPQNSDTYELLTDQKSLDVS